MVANGTAIGYRVGGRAGRWRRLAARGRAALALPRGDDGEVNRRGARRRL